MLVGSGDGETLFGLGSIQQSYEYTVPAEFDSAKSIRCAIPTTYYAGGKGIFDFSKTLHVRATNDGLSARFTNSTFVFAGTTPQLGAPSAHNQLNSAYKSLRLTGDCLATPIVLWMSGFLLIVLIIMLACFVCIACRAAGSSEDGEIQKELLTRIVREVRMPDTKCSPSQLMRLAYFQPSRLIQSPGRWAHTCTSRRQLTCRHAKSTCA